MKKENVCKIDLIALRNYRSSIRCYIRGIHEQHQAFIRSLDKTEASQKLRVKAQELAQNVMAELLVHFTFLISIEEATQGNCVDTDQLKLIQPDENQDREE